MQVDEPARRRSTRATRGKHSRYEEEPEEVKKVRFAVAEGDTNKKDSPKKDTKTAKTAKKDTKAKAKPAPKAAEEEGVVNCPCGATEDDPADGKIMIECEECLEWQHSSCVLQTNDLDQVPDHYVCGTCFDKKTTTEEEKLPQKEADGDEEYVNVESESRGDQHDKPLVPSKSVSKSTHKRVGHIDDITEKVRKSAASALKGIFVSVPNTKYTIPVAGETAEVYCENLALTIEQELYNVFGTVEPEIGSNYRDKFRTLSFNLRDAKNETLRVRVLNGHVTPTDLVALSSEEMMNPELQKLAEEVRAEAIRESVLVVDEAPRLRRTHKGEEIVGEYEEYIDNVDLALKMEKQRGEGEEARAARAAERAAIADLEGEKEVKEGSTVSEGADEKEVEKEGVAPVIPAWKSELDLDDDDTHSEHSHTSDQLNDILGDVSRPHREAETDDWGVISSAPFVWSGTVPMTGLDKTTCTAFSLGSSSDVFDPLVTWGSIFYASKPMTVEGRLDKSKADPYLAQVLGSGSRDVAALALVPSDEDPSAYYKLYEYFHSRRKYGVIHNRSGLVKDAYLIPVAPEDTPPYTLGSLVRPSVELSTLKRSRPLLVVLYVVGKLKRGSESQGQGQGLPKRRAMRDRVKGDQKKVVASDPRKKKVVAGFVTPVPHPVSVPVPTAPDLESLKNLVNDAALQAGPDLMQNPTLLMSIIDQAKKRE